MRKRNLAIKETMPSLQTCYPELSELLEDLDGFYKFVCIRLRNFKLDGRYTPDEVINECIVRWHRAVQEEKPIPNITAWMKLTANYVVHELKRQTKKVDVYDPTIVETLPSSTNVDGLETIEQRQLVLKALATLPEDKRKLLYLRFFQSLSWDEISVRYADRGQKVTIATLRKRGERALKELKEVFLKMLRD